MTEAATRLIDAFRALPPEDRMAVLTELARSAEFDAGPIGDDELVSAGVQLFAMYDAEEATDAAS